MKSKIKIISSIILFSVVFASCSVVQPVAVTDNPVGKKKGVAKAKAFMGICPSCDVSLVKAAKNGKIDKIATVDFKMKWGILFVTYETIVTGE